MNGAGRTAREPNEEGNTGDPSTVLQNILLGGDSAGGNRSASSSESEEGDFSEADPPSSGQDEESARPAAGDPLYDARADSEDERWVKRNLIRRPAANATPAGSKASGSNDTAFQLSCPSCFALLCVQCQPHELYEGQFRAMFVQNCVTKTGETLRVRVTVEGKDEVRSNRDLFRPVACTKCGTEVAVQDADDVYHFCNVVY